MLKLYVAANAATHAAGLIAAGCAKKTQKEAHAICTGTMQVYEVVIKLAPHFDQRSSRNRRAMAGGPKRKTGLVLKGSQV